MTSGHPNPETPRRYPAISGPIDDARLLETAVMLAAAARSPGDTTAITYELRVGTSICERTLRASRRTIAQARFGANGTSMSRTLDGRWVNTIVLIKPKRSAMRTATRYENADRVPVQKNIVPATA